MMPCFTQMNGPHILMLLKTISLMITGMYRLKLLFPQVHQTFFNCWIPFPRVKPFLAMHTVNHKSFKGEKSCGLLGSSGMWGKVSRLFPSPPSYIHGFPTSLLSVLGAFEGTYNLVSPPGNLQEGMKAQVILDRSKCIIQYSLS